MPSSFLIEISYYTVRVNVSTNRYAMALELPYAICQCSAVSLMQFCLSNPQSVFLNKTVAGTVLRSFEVLGNWESSHIYCKSIFRWVPFFMFLVFNLGIQATKRKWINKRKHPLKADSVNNHLWVKMNLNYLAEISDRSCVFLCAQ